MYLFVVLLLINEVKKNEYVSYLIITFLKIIPIYVDLFTYVFNCINYSFAYLMNQGCLTLCVFSSLSFTHKTSPPSFFSRILPIPSLTTNSSGHVKDSRAMLLGALSKQLL